MPTTIPTRGSIVGCCASAAVQRHKSKTAAANTVIFLLSSFARAINRGRDDRSDRPPHRSVRAELPHTVLTLDVDMQTSRWDRGEGSSESLASACRAWRTLPKSGGGLVGCDAGGCAAT